MKKLLLISLLAFSTGPLFADDAPMTLRQHMRAMGYLLDEVFSRTDNPINYPDAAEKTRELRGHIAQAIALSPSRIAQMPPRERNGAMIEYHQLMSRVIYLSASLEKAFDAGDDFIPESSSRQDDIKNLLHEINVIIGKAHRLFRD